MTEQHKKEVQTIEPQNHAPTVVTPSQVLAKAYEQGASVEQLTQLLDLQEKFYAQQEKQERREAEKAFHLALARFKANPPRIGKDKHVSFQTNKGVTEYNHASLANVVYTVSEALSEHGLSASWETGQDNGMITVTCFLSHELGHQTKVSLSAGRDESGGKNSIQAVGSTVSYLQRYTLLAITGLATHEQDDDGKASQSQYVSFEQAQEIDQLIDEVGGDKQALVEHFGVSTVNELPADKYLTIISTIKKKAQTKGGQK